MAWSVRLDSSTICPASVASFATHRFSSTRRPESFASTARISLALAATRLELFWANSEGSCCRAWSVAAEKNAPASRSHQQSKTRLELGAILACMAFPITKAHRPDTYLHEVRIRPVSLRNGKCHASKNCAQFESSLALLVASASWGIFLGCNAPCPATGAFRIGPE